VTLILVKIDHIWLSPILINMMMMVIIIIVIVNRVRFLQCLWLPPAGSPPPFDTYDRYLQFFCLFKPINYMWLCLHFSCVLC